MRNAMKWANLTIFLASVLTIAAVVNIFAQRDEFRMRIDSTKTRAYSLSDQTMRMLGSLDGDWTIALFIVEREADRAMLRQIDEVLSRFRQATSHVSVARIDPTDPTSLAEYERMLTRLRSMYAQTTADYETHLDAGRRAFEDMLVFAQQESGTLEQLLQLARLSAQRDSVSEAIIQRINQRTQAMALLAEQGGLVLEEVTKALRVGDDRPIPDYDGARSILAHALRSIANDLHATAESFASWRDDNEMPAEARQYAVRARRSFADQATQLAQAAEPLVHLPPMELSRIGRELAEGEGALILGPGRAAIVPADQLVAKSNLRESGDGAVTFDQRFRGEQLIAAAIRSLTVEHMPLVVFVHSEERSLLRQHERQIDLFGTATMLMASRFEIMEWTAGEQERPQAKPGQPVVYVVIPPPQRQGLEPSQRERDLLARVNALIAEGESVLLSVYPSRLPRLGQPDPWARIAAPFGMHVDTSMVIHESVLASADQREVIKGQAVQRFESSHPIAQAVHGQQAYLNLPTPIQISDFTGVEHHILAQVPPAENRWLEQQWEIPGDRLDEPRDDQRLDEPAPIIVAAERPHPMKPGRQRLLLVSSGGWMLSYVADAAVSIGGDRMALVYPAHHELMLASAAWLAGMDDLIARSPTSQEVARLGEIGTAAGWFWTILFIGGLPLGSLLLGLGVWMIRKR